MFSALHSLIFISAVSGSSTAPKDFLPIEVFRSATNLKDCINGQGRTGIDQNIFQSLNLRADFRYRIQGNFRSEEIAQADTATQRSLDVTLVKVPSQQSLKLGVSESLFTLNGFSVITALLGERPLTLAASESAILAVSYTIPPTDTLSELAVGQTVTYCRWITSTAPIQIVGRYAAGGIIVGSSADKSAPDNSSSSSGSSAQLGGSDSTSREASPSVGKAAGCGLLRTENPSP